LDSNIDWGQDLLYLKKWLDKHPDAKLAGLAYYGSYPAALAGIPETPHPLAGPGPERAASDSSETDCTAGASVPHGSNCTAEGGCATQQLGPKPGWYALSVNYLYDRSRQYRYFLDHFTPVASAGYSIYIYHITLDEANQVRRELGLPELTAEEVQDERENARSVATSQCDAP
jgi:hypothetical protein